MKKFVFVAMLIVCVMSFVCLSAAQQARTAGVPKGAVSDKAQAGSIGPGTVVEAPSSDVSYEPTAAQIAAHEQVMAAKSKHLAPPLGPHTTAADVARPSGPPTDVSLQQASPEAASTFTVFKKSLINSICSGCGESTVNEPSAANSGKNVVETSNWNIAYSLNGGATWLNQNPYALSPGYCCDTQVVYDQERDVFILLLLDYTSEGASTNGFTLSVARGSFPSTGPNWCTYKFNGGSFGEGATDTLDFAKIALSNSNLFVTWNDYPPSSGFTASGLARFPLDALATCAGFGYTYLERNTEFTFALAQQPSAHDQFYWVSNWFLDGTVSGQNLRIFQWADNSGSYSYNTVGINAYTFGTAPCGSPNWCSRLDPRSESVVITPAEYRAQANSAFAGDDILEVATTAGAGGPFSYNYVVYNYFKLHSLTYIGNDQTYGGTNFVYPGCAVNEKGYVGCSLSQGVNAPGGIIILQDNVSPTQPWAYSSPVNGISGASAWGDYNETNPWHPGGGPFQTVQWNVSSLGKVQPYYLVWGRGNDTNDYNRWKAK
jgi:hypothetical protein